MATESTRWLLSAVGAAVILLGLVACNVQPDRTPTGQGTAAVPTPTATDSTTPTVAEVSTPLPTVVPPAY